MHAKILQEGDAERPAAQSPLASAAERDATQPASWWRHPMVWLVISGPLLVVIAGFWTLWLAISHPDPVIAERPAPTHADSDAHTLAVQARNHAATSRAKP